MTTTLYVSRDRPSTAKALRVSAAVGGVMVVAFVVGAITAILPPWLTIALILVPSFAIMAWLRPPYAIVAVAAVAAGLIHPAFLPELRLLGGTVQASELGLAATLTLVYVKYFGEIRNRLRPLRPLFWPGVAFGAVFLASIVTAKLHGVAGKDVLGEFRHFLYWLVIPAAVVAFSDERDFRRGITAILVVAVLFSVGQIVQGVLGIQVFARSARFEALNTLGDVHGDVIRSITPGIYLVLFGLTLVTGMYMVRRSSPVIAFVLMALFLGAILLSFGRVMWAATAASLGVVLFSLGFKRGLGMLSALTLAGLLFLSVTSIVRPQILQAAIERVASIGEEVERGQSFGWRLYEADWAAAKIKGQPLTGIGLGGTYRPPAPSDVVPEQVRYVHSGYLYLPLKMGLIALPIFLWWIAALLAPGIRVLRQKRVDLNQAVAAAGVATVTCILLVSFTQPTMVTSPGIACMALATAVMLRAKENLGGH